MNKRNARDDVSLVAHMVHDLKNPLGIVLGYAEAMTLADSSEQAELSSRLIINARAVLEVLDQYSLLADLRRKRITLERTRCDWRTLSGRVLKDVAEAARERDQEITCRADEAVTVHADAHRLEQVMRLLTREALRSTVRGTRLLLTAQPVEGAVELRLSVTAASSDNVPDSPTALQVFDPERPVIELVQRLVELHGGSLSFDSEPNQAAAIVLLPTARTSSRGSRRVGRAAG